MKLYDWSNKRVDESVIIERVGTYTDGAVDRPLWSCRCDCGEVFCATAERIRNAKNKKHRARLRCATCTRSAVAAAAKKANAARHNKEPGHVR